MERLRRMRAAVSGELSRRELHIFAILAAEIIALNILWAPATLDFAHFAFCDSGANLSSIPDRARLSANYRFRLPLRPASDIARADMVRHCRGRPNHIPDTHSALWFRNGVCLCKNRRDASPPRYKYRDYTHHALVQHSSFLSVHRSRIRGVATYPGAVRAGIRTGETLSDLRERRDLCQAQHGICISGVADRPVDMADAAS